MPRRTNLFQDVVAIIHRHMAGDAAVEESAMLTDRVTGRKREVDVAITTRVARQDLTLSVEATSAGRRADLPWVEQTIAKHADLSTGKLVLVAEAGFTTPGREAAERAGAVPIAPEDLTGVNPAYEVVSRLPSLWPKSISLAPESARVDVQRPAGDVVWFRAPPDTMLVLENGTEVGTLLDGFRAVTEANWPTVTEQIGLPDITESIDRFFVLEVASRLSITVDGQRLTLCTRFEPDSGKAAELHPIEKLRVIGRASIKVSEIPLVHQRLGDVDVSYGEGEVAGHPALLVVTEDESGGAATVRFRTSSGEQGDARLERPSPPDGGPTDL